MLKYIFSIAFFAFTNTVFSQLFINEVNQGIGTAEYAELLVVGTKTCIDSCVNLQNWILDDNNGFYGPNGIAAGHIRFNSDPQWQCVPYGTIIVIYNSANPFPGIVADETDANNDNVYILPSSSTFFEKDIFNPTGGTPSATYAGGFYTSGGGVWDKLGMQNGNDAFQTVSPTNLTAGFHSVGWGSSAGMDISFAGSASGLLFQNENLVDLNPANQGNWTSQNQNLGTPGLGNSVANIAWINAMRIPATNCDFCITNASFWVKGDTGAFNGISPVSSGTVSTWQNQVSNINVPALLANGTPQLQQNLPVFNGNSAMFFQNNYFSLGGLLNNAVLDPNQGSMFVVSTTAGLSFNFAVVGPSNGTCGGNRCSSGYRGNRSEFGSANNLFAGATNPGIANVLSMTANDLTSQHFNSINGVESIGTTVNAIAAQAVPFGLNIGTWPGFSMNNQYVAEALAFNRELTQSEVYIVESYLAIKYGVTISSHNYVNSSGASTWTNGLGFDNNIAGIHRDDCFGLYQLKSKSVHPTSVLTMALTDNGGSFTTPNNFMTDMSSVVWGNNNDALDFICSPNTPPGYSQVLQRDWLQRKAGTAGAVSMSFDLTPFTPGFTIADVALVVDVNQNGLFSDETAIVPNSIVGNELFFDNINIADSVMFSLVQLGNLPFDTINQLICSGDSFLFNTNYYTIAGTYTDTIPTTVCDSVVTLNLSLQVCSNCNMDLGNDTLICGAVNYTLDAGTFDEYLWQDNSTNQTFTATSSGQYFCQGTNYDTTNLVVNSGFESGNVNFTTDYVVGTGGAWGQITNAGDYAINTSPSNVHNNFPFCGDHTTGTGNMMIVNGSNTANQAVWCQTIPVDPNTEYYFSIWATSVENTNAANVSSLFFELNGTQIGTNFSPVFNACSWQEYTQTWNSGANITVDLCIYNHTITGNNDFAIDDIFFGEACVTSDTINILSETNLVDSALVDICFGESAMIFGNNETMEALYLDTIKTLAGCDSLYLKRYLNVRNESTSDTTFSCTNILANAGISVIDTLFNDIGCDSIYNFSNVMFAPKDSSYTLSCTDMAAMAGLVRDTAQNTMGCDSFYTVTETRYYAPTTTVLIDSCTNTAANALNQTDTISTTLGCDSIYEISIVRFINPVVITLPDSCTNVAAQATTITTISPSVQGCDSFTVTQDVVFINPITETLTPIEICEGETATIFGNTENTSGTFNQNIMSVGGCDSISRTQVLVVNPLPSINAGTDTTINTGEDATLNATGGNTYTWSNGESGSFISVSPENTTTFTVLASDINNCSGSDSVTVFVLFEEVQLFLPTAFSPNGDGTNDVFRIINESNFENISLRVYNRWGEMVFNSTEFFTEWDGKYKGKDQALDNYVYYVEATAKANGQQFKVSGSITIIR